MSSKSWEIFTLDELVSQSYEREPDRVALMQRIVNIAGQVEKNPGLPDEVNSVTLTAMVMLGGQLEIIRKYFKQKHHGNLTEGEESFINNDLPTLMHFFNLHSK